uniref:Si:dkey-65l23.2 n=1 Tax=Nothobranchius rachovii TaxID=451742 RepID=A0A1A8S306_9TELE
MSNYSQFQETPNYCQAQAVWSPEHTTEVGDVYSHSDNLMPDPSNNTTPRSKHYGHLRPSQLARDVVFTGACDQRSTHEQVHNEMMSASGAVQYHQLQVPQGENLFPPHISRRYTPLRAHQHAQNDVTMQGDNEHILKDIAIRKMTEMLSQVLVVVKEVSRDVQFIKSELADGKITPASCEGPLPDTVQQMLPIQLPITSEDDFNKAELLLKNEPDRQKMIARLALVGGTTSTCMIRRMLVTVLTNSLACKFNWAGKKRTPHDSKQPFKDTMMQDCMFAAARQYDRHLTQQAFSDTVKKWLRYAPWRAGGKKTTRVSFSHGLWRWSSGCIVSVTKKILFPVICLTIITFNELF